MIWAKIEAGVAVYPPTNDGNRVNVHLDPTWLVAHGYQQLTEAEIAAATPPATEEWAPISAFVGALYALVPPESVAQVLQSPVTLKSGIAGMALLSSDAAPGGMINLLDQRVADWLTLVGLTVDQVRAAMASPAAETEA